MALTIALMKSIHTVAILEEQLFDLASNCLQNSMAATDRQSCSSRTVTMEMEEDVLCIVSPFRA